MIADEEVNQAEVSHEILLLRQKIQDESYLDNAIQRIALVLSRKIVEKPRGFKEAMHGSF